ncbi:MAG TPA: NUDIX hydrolase [Alphaproteobacteria bacterium]|jgi:8-oxo-dGTP pyrophosphatase MutT (NUDIX family)|nr:NUDIX hydrolase [Alphaproteobacteria bacterium]MDP7165053.1 NUDIX hydrolase [Alphaproteobacteria bacterium]MDP7429162.1 NUDIX hydrolase [Alphaproteobacteria bacterium]HJM49080.1 NUDIX hydrolase [Alphaproteobacteria bacterium]
MTKLARLEAAATVMLVRDGAAGIEVFMMGRRGDLEVAPRALVFPGGKVDEADASRGLAERCAGAAAWDDEERAFRVAAVRESFEECGLLLARRQGGEVLLGGDEAAALGRRYLQDGHHSLDLEALVRAEDLELATNLLLPCSRWVTPASRPRRFDAVIYLAPAPPGQQARHDGGEASRSFWAVPARVLAEVEAGQHHMLVPTRRSLRFLSRQASVAEAREAAAKIEVKALSPDLERADGGFIARLENEAGDGIEEFFIADPPTR